MGMDAERGCVARVSARAKSADVCQVGSVESLEFRGVYGLGFGQGALTDPGLGSIKKVWSLGLGV